MVWTLGADPGIGLQWPVDSYPRRHVEKRAAGPQRIRERSRPVLFARNLLAEVRPNQFRVYRYRGCEITEHNPALAELLKLAIEGKFRIFLRRRTGRTGR